MTTIRHATGMDKARLVEMTTRFLLESSYGRLFNGQTQESIEGMIDNVLAMGVILVAVPNPEQEAMKARLDKLSDDDRLRAVMAMSTTQKAVLNFGDEYGPNKPALVGMLAIVALPHPLAGGKVAEELAWWVEPEWRQGLLGPKMLREAEAWATRNGAVMVKMVAPAGTDVGEFYERIGYQAVETAYIKSI